MAFILHIETSTTNCSVGLSENEVLLGSKEINEGYTHAENLHFFIQDVLKECHISVNQLNAVAVGKGPGSYTGLRIGVSAAKGLAYALNIPLISIPSLQIMAAMASKQMQSKGGLLQPMLDARRMEVYTCRFDDQLSAISETEALIIDNEHPFESNETQEICFFGDGMNKCKPFLSQTNFSFIENIFPSALYMPELAYEKYKNSIFEDVAYFEPFYLKDFIGIQKK